MNTHGSFIGDLEYAIAHGSDARRVTALRLVTNFFVSSAEQLNEEHIDLFDEVIGRLIDHIESRALVELSERLAPIGNAPPKTVRKLAYRDDIDVARPVLARSERLTEADLMRIAKAKGQQHLLAISGRKQLSEPLTDVLVKRGDMPVTHCLASNPGARLSDTAVTALADSAEKDPVLGEKLVVRPDIPLHVFCRLLACATDIVVHRLLVVASADAKPEVQRVVTRIAGEVAAGAPAPRYYAAALRSVLLMYTAGLLDEHKLLEFASAKCVEESVAALSILCSVPVDIADQLVFSEHIEAFLILCRSANLRWPTVRAVIQLRPPDYHVSPQRLMQVWEDFGKLSPSTAKAVLNHWRAQGFVGRFAGTRRVQ